MTGMSRRTLLLGGLGLGAAALTGCTSAPAAGPVPSASGPMPTLPPATPNPGQRIVEQVLTAKPVTLDLGGPTVSTWAYGDTAPGPVVRATAGDFLRVRVDNQLPADTTIHWHGIRLHNKADGVPGMTQDPVRPAGRSPTSSPLRIPARTSSTRTSASNSTAACTPLSSSTTRTSRAPTTPSGSSCSTTGSTAPAAPPTTSSRS